MLATSALITITTTSVTNAAPVATDPCLACQQAVDVVRTYALNGNTPAATQIFASYICKVFEVQTKTVCDQVVTVFSEDVSYVFEHLTLDTKEVCSMIMTACDSRDIPYARCNITLPDVPKPRPVKPQLPPWRSSVTRILQISDIHYDTLYQPGALAVCDEPLCCRKFSTGNGNDTAGYWGHRGNCDMPYWTIENMLQHITKHDEFDYVYWTGDLSAHNVWEQTQQGQIDIYKNITALFLKYFKDKPVFSALGNHESVPVDSFPTPSITGGMTIEWLYDVMEQSWTNWIPKRLTAADIKKGAYYTTMIKPGLRLISVNTQYCDNLNLWLLLNDTDPTGELRWLADTLQQAEDNMEKVHIIGHIPPGISDCLRSWSYNYYKIVNRYENTIAGQFYGHTHNDQFQLFYDNDNTKRRPVSAAFIGPSVTTYQNLDPSYRIYTVDEGSHMILDHETYVMNVTHANLRGRKPKWKLEYSAKDAFVRLTKSVP